MRVKKNWSHKYHCIGLYSHHINNKIIVALDIVIIFTCT